MKKRLCTRRIRTRKSVKAKAAVYFARNNGLLYGLFAVAATTTTKNYLSPPRCPSRRELVAAGTDNVTTATRHTRCRFIPRTRDYRRGRYFAIIAVNRTKKVYFLVLTEIPVGDAHTQIRKRTRRRRRTEKRKENNDQTINDRASVWVVLFAVVGWLHMTTGGHGTVGGRERSGSAGWTASGGRVKFRSAPRKTSSREVIPRWNKSRGKSKSPPVDFRGAVGFSFATKMSTISMNFPLAVSPLTSGHDIRKQFRNTLARTTTTTTHDHDNYRAHDTNCDRRAHFTDVKNEWSVIGECPRPLNSFVLVLWIIIA